MKDVAPVVEDAAKPRRRRKDARPGEIVAAGFAEFAAHGYADARMTRIAATAGIAKPTIYLYYRSKQALFMAVVEDHLVQILAENEAMLDRFDGTTEQILTRLLQGFYDRITQGHAQTLFRIIIAEGDKIPEIVEDYHQMAIRRGTALLMRILQRGVARGEVAADSPIMVNPQVIIAPTMFFALHNLVFHRIETLDYQPYFAAHLAMLLNGVSRPGVGE